MATLPEILAGQGESLVGTAIAVDCDGGSHALQADNHAPTLETHILAEPLSKPPQKLNQADSDSLDAWCKNKLEQRDIRSLIYSVKRCCQLVYGKGKIDCFTNLFIVDVKLNSEVAFNDLNPRVKAWIDSLPKRSFNERGLIHQIFHS